MAPSREQHAFVLSKRGRRREPELVRGSSGRELEMAVCSRTQNPLREAPGGRHRRADGTEPAVGMWVADEDAPRCQRPACRDSPAFGLFWKRRRCDRCGAVVCSSCVAPEPLYLDQWVREGQRNPGTLRGASADSSGWFAPRQVCIDCFRSSATAGSGALQHHQLEQLRRELPTTGSVALVSLGTGVAGGWSSFARSPPDARTRLAYRRLACAMLLHERVARRSHWPDGVELGLVKFIADQPCLRAQGTALDAALAQQFKDKARDYNSTSRRISGLRWKPLNRKCAGVASLFGVGAAAGCAGAVPTIAAGTILKVGSCGFAAGVIPGTAFCLTCTHPEDDLPPCYSQENVYRTVAGVSIGGCLGAAAAGVFASVMVVGAFAGHGTCMAAHGISSAVVASGATSVATTTIAVAAKAAINAPIPSVTVPTMAYAAVRFGPESQCGKALQSSANACTGAGADMLR